VNGPAQIGRAGVFDNLQAPHGAVPLDSADQALLDAALETMRLHYRPFWHTVAAALRGQDGRIWTGLHLGATVGRLSICAEAVALGRAVMEGGRIATVVAVRHPKPDEDDRTLAVVSPCGACREMVMDYAPDAWVIVPGAAGPFKLPARTLLPLPYRR
jgi:cytidine deaminase